MKAKFKPGRTEKIMGTKQGPASKDRDLFVYLFKNGGPGGLVSQRDAVISVFDHGVLYGDGVFEGIRIYQGRSFKLDEHLDRLEKSAEAIFLDLPLKKEALKKAVVETVEANIKMDSGLNYIRLVATRGSGVSPETIFCASPSTMAVLPTPGSPIRTGLFFVLRQRI